MEWYDVEPLKISEMGEQPVKETQAYQVKTGIKAKCFNETKGMLYGNL